MVYKKVARIEERISAVGVGCWNFGGDWDTSDDENAIKIVHAAIDQGINLFDVAPVYGWFHAERVLGRALRGGRREKVLICSKCGLVWDERHLSVNDLSRKNILREIDGSLERLQTDYIDIYQLHWPDPKTPIEETAEALIEIKKAGKIRHAGLSNFSQADVERFMEIVDIDEQQGLYNMFERNTGSYHGIPLAYRTEKEMLPTVRKYGQAFLPYSPLFQGLLAGKFRDGLSFSARDIRSENPKFAEGRFEVYYERYKRIQTIADEMERPIAQVALNWLRQKPEVTSIINGVSSLSQLRKNVASTEWDIPDDYMAKINQAIAPFENL
ncbi:MAG: aldo/keto reductase [Clostridiales bacterium]|nr:aldo/keto reductase [Clostridiales bacterium]